MKIGVDASVFVDPLTGIGNYSYHLLVSAASLMPGDEFVLFSNRPLSVDFNQNNISVCLVRNGIITTNNYLWKLIGLGLSAKKENVDIFWSTSGAPSIWHSMPVLLTIYDYVYRFEPTSMSWKSRIFRTISQSYWVKHAKKIFTISNAVANETRNFYSCEVDNVILPSTDKCFTPLNKIEIDEVKNKHHLTGNYNLIVGTLEPRKNIQVFLDVYIKLFSKYELPPLIMVGYKGWKNKDINQIIHYGEKLGCVKPLGYINNNDLPALYSGADIFFMPSKYEGFGMPILEARMCGTPVVCSNVPAMKESGGDAVFYHSSSREGITHALEEIYINKRKMISDKGKGIKWSWESGAEQLRELFIDTYKQ